MSHRLMWILCAALAGASGAGAAPERYTVDAQYRGGLTIDFPRLGETTLSFDQRPDGAIHVTGNGHVKHPRKPETYDIKLDMVFKSEANRVQVLSRNGSSNEAGTKLKDKIEKILPLLWVVRSLPPHAAQGARFVHTPNGPYSVSAEDSGATRTVSVDLLGKHIGRFFLTGHGTAAPARLTGFEIPTKDQVVLSFTGGSRYASAVPSDD